MAGLHRFALLLLSGVLGCSGPKEDAPVSGPGAAAACTEGTPGCIGWKTCPPEFVRDDDRGGCREILPADACPAGTMATLGKDACVPIGPSSCAPGFAAGAGGWGCDPVLPKNACPGATRDELGSETCVPIGDCNAPFPPPGATHVVNAAFSDAELGPKKFRRIVDAIVAAPSGAVIAIESGTYAEGIRAERPVTVVGRCAAKVRLVGTGLAVHGILALKVKDVAVRGVTLEDHFEGIRAQGGGTVKLSDSVVEGARFTGVIAWQPGSAVSLERVVVRKTKPEPSRDFPVFSLNADGGGAIDIVASSIQSSWEAGVVATNDGAATKTPSKVSLSRSVVRDTNLVERSPAGGGVVISGISVGTVTESAILDTRRIGAIALFPEADLTITRSSILRSLEDKSGEVAAGAFADEGKLSLDEVTLRDNAQAGLVAFAKARVTVTRSAITGSHAGADGDFGMGAWADQASSLSIATTALVGNAYYGVGLYGAGTEAKLQSVLVTGTRRSPKDVLGRGISVEEGAGATLDEVTLAGNGDEQLFVRGETAGGARSHATATRLFVHDSATRKDGTTGTGIAIEAGATLSMERAAIVRARRAGLVVNDTPGGAGSLAEADVVHTVVRETLAAGDGLSGKGIAIEGAGVAAGGALHMRASAIVDSVQFGLVVGNGSGKTTIENCLVTGTRPQAGGDYGHGIVATGGPVLVARAIEVRDNRIGLAFGEAAAVVTGSFVHHNEVGIHVQEGTNLTTGALAGDPTPQVVFVSDDSTFEDNQTRVGSGLVVLPTAPIGSAPPGSTKPKPGF